MSTLTWTGAVLVGTWFFAGSVPVTMAGCVLMLWGLVFTPEPLEDDPLYRYLDAQGLIDRRTP